MTLEKLKELYAEADLQEGKWRDGIAGNANLVAYNGEDIVGIGSIYSDKRRSLIAALHNAFPDLAADYEAMDVALRTIEEAGGAAGFIARKTRRSLRLKEDAP